MGAVKIMYEVYCEETGKAKPKAHERHTADILANHFKSDIIFLRRGTSKTPDLLIVKSGIRWELKSPEGGGKRTIQNNLRNIDRQSENVVLDLSRAKLTDEQGVSRTKEFLRMEHARIKRLKIILKTGKIIDIRAKKR